MPSPTTAEYRIEYDDGCVTPDCSIAGRERYPSPRILNLAGRSVSGQSDWSLARAPGISGAMPRQSLSLNESSKASHVLQQGHSLWSCPRGLAETPREFRYRYGTSDCLLDVQMSNVLSLSWFVDGNLAALENTLAHSPSSTTLAQ